MADVDAQLKKLKDLYIDGHISKEDYDTRRLALIDAQLDRPSARAQQPPSSPRKTATTTPAAASGATSPRAGRGRGLGSVFSHQLSAAATSPRRIAAADPAAYEDVARESAQPGSPRAKSPPRFNSAMPYDPKNYKKSYKEDHERASVPMPPKGVVGQRVALPEGLSQFTALKVIQEPEKPKLGVYLGPTGSAHGSVYGSQPDVRRKAPIGGPEVSVRGHIGSTASTVSSVTVHTAGTPQFQERVYVNTACIDLISACVRHLGMVHPPSNFGMIARSDTGDSWVAPEKLISELPPSDQLIVVPREGCSTEIKKAYFEALTRIKASGAPVESDSNFSAEDVQSAPNQGKGLYYAYK